MQTSQNRAAAGIEREREPLRSTSRREFVGGAAAILGACLSRSLVAGFTAQNPRRSRDVSWLNDVLQPPVVSVVPPHPLAPVLIDPSGHAITTLDGWRQRRVDLERAWQGVLGPLELQRGSPPRFEVLGEERVGAVIRQHVRYLVEPDAPTEAYILSPRQRRARCPGAVVFHTTTPESIRQPAGLADVEEKHFGLALARRGFVAFCPRNFLWPETTRMAAEQETERFRRRHPRARGMAKMLFDAQVALDILAAHPDVDPNRIGCIGHSLGAKEALYLAAFDRRITAVVSSEGGIGTMMSNWDAEWYPGRRPETARLHA